VIGRLCEEPGDFQSSGLNPQPYHSSLGQVQEIFPSVPLATTGVDPHKCGRFRYVESIVTNTYYNIALTFSSPCQALHQPKESRSSIVVKGRSCLRSRSKFAPALQGWNFLGLASGFLTLSSVQRSTVLGNKRALNFRLEVHSATSGKIFDTLYEHCTEKESQNLSVESTLVDFTSKTNIIAVEAITTRVTREGLSRIERTRNIK